MGGKLLWQHECYAELALQIDGCFTVFSSDKFLIGFLFTNEREAHDFLEVFQKKRPASKIKRSPPPLVAIQPLTQPAAAAVAVPAAPKKEIVIKKTKRVTKGDIGRPTNFQRISHIGFDAETGFDLQNVPPEWLHLFEKAGVTDAQLKNAETAKFIVDFVERRGGPPPVPPRASSIRMPTNDSEDSDEVSQPIPPPTPPVRANSCSELNRQIPESSEATKKPVGNTPAAGLMQSIKDAGGIASLRKTASIQRPAPTDFRQDESQMDIASLLAKALAERHISRTDSSDGESD